MSSHNLFSLLNAYHPTDINEVESKNRTIAFIHNHPTCFDRSLESGHITASAWLLNKAEDKALLMHHAKLNQWFQLGGHCDGNSDTLAVAIKEAQEESGIEHIVPISQNIFDIDVHLIPATSKEKEHYHYDVRFLLKAASDENVIQNHESKELRWIGKNVTELPTQGVSVIRMFNKWIKKPLC